MRCYHHQLSHRFQSGDWLNNKCQVPILQKCLNLFEFVSLSNMLLPDFSLSKHTINMQDMVCSMYMYHTCVDFTCLNLVKKKKKQSRKKKNSVAHLPFLEMQGFR